MYSSTYFINMKLFFSIFLKPIQNLLFQDIVFKEIWL